MGRGWRTALFAAGAAAAWSAPGPLSFESVAKGSAPVKFPDFTRGKWKEKRVNLPSA